MAIKTVDELIEAVKARVGEDNSDETIALLEDISDTFAAQHDGTDWKQKYEENDAEWRQKYKDRFSKKPDDEDEDIDQPQENDRKTTDYESLFTVKE